MYIKKNNINIYVRLNKKTIIIYYNKKIIVTYEFLFDKNLKLSSFLYTSFYIVFYCIVLV